MYRIRAFRAINDLASCERFAQGHLNVLAEYGVTKVTTAKLDWFHNPDVYVVLIESEDGTEVYGGERIHIANRQYRLPIEEAISVVDSDIFPLVEEHREALTGELCGLWNSKAIAGRGFSVLLTKIGVAIARLLKMGSLFVLCAPYTVAMCQQAGFTIEESIGNKGTYFYPKLDLIATVLMVKDLVLLPTADEAFRQRIIDISENPIQEAIEEGPKGSFTVKIDLSLITGNESSI